MRTLRFGDRGADVMQLQLALSRAGYAVGGIDGIFGPKTLNALRRFQAANGLAIDGIAGINTRTALNKYLLGYFNHRIERGDTYYKLAQRYGTGVKKIASANPDKNPDNLIIGDTVVIPFGFDVVPTNVMFTSLLTETVIKGLKARYPFISAEMIGSSTMGTPLYALRMGNGTKKVLYNASHHANEWITTPVLLKFLEQYAEAYIGGGSIFGLDAARLYDEVSLILVPLVNPDGVDLVNGALALNDRFYVQARRIAAEFPKIPFPAGWKANIEGTDLNLNYPAGWEEAKRIKFELGYTKPAPRDYVGDGELSAVESRAMYDFTLKERPELTLSYHSQGEVIYWKYLDIEPENGFAIANRFSEASGYSVETTPYESGYAGYKDWFILEFERPGYTIEVGRGINPLPLSQFDKIYGDNVGILAIGLDAAAEL